MTRIIAIANQKGGVGKTTTSVNLGASLAASGCKILLVDLDPQGNATTGTGVNKGDLKRSVCDWLMGDCSPEELVWRCPGALDLAPANGDLTAAEIALMATERREAWLRARLIALESPYHYVIIDCPPALNLLTLNALVAAHGVLIPMQCEYYALEGLTALLETIEGVRRRANPGLALEGLLRTMYDPRSGLTREVSRQLLEHFGEQVFRTVIPRNIRLAEAPSHGRPALLYDRHSRGAVAYMALAGELLGRHGASRAAQREPRHGPNQTPGASARSRPPGERLA